MDCVLTLCPQLPVLFLSRIFSSAIEIDEAGQSPSNLDGTSFTAQQGAATAKLKPCADQISNVTVRVCRQRIQSLVSRILSILLKPHFLVQ